METKQVSGRFRLIGMLALGMLLAGCASPNLYSWGRYEDLVYAMYKSPDKATPEFQIEQMEKDIQRARSANKPLPPGFHAHLGYLYFQIGKADAARQEFATEKAQFPESAVFMDRLLAKLEAK
jgi:hypothetical protein